MIHIIDPGHKYLLPSLDSDEFKQTLQYVKRCVPQEKYPGNVDAYPGTTLQDVTRTQIQRLIYVNNQQNAVENEFALSYYKMAILMLEKRAARCHGRVLNLSGQQIDVIHLLPQCPKCWHIECLGTCH